MTEPYGVDSACKVYRPGTAARWRPLLVLATLVAMPASARGAASSAEELARMSLTELANVEVTSVSKSAQSLSGAAAAVYVISRGQIPRSGATTLPDALRLAPNLQVTQLTSTNIVVTARGFGGSPAAQNFSNKLLILIDGRSVYSPLFSGVYWDVQDVVMDDVERIEVISGPGATLWGANAVNGVINVVTRSSADTRGALLHAGSGGYERLIEARYGATAGESATYRVYAKAFERDSLGRADGRDSNAGWRKAQAGLRYDREWARDALMAQADVYDGTQSQADGRKGTIRGANVLARWQHQADGSRLQAKAYYDQTERAAPPGGVAFVLRTWDFDLQHQWQAGARHEVVWGAGYRVNRYAITNSPGLRFIPPRRTLSFGNVFAQDSISIAPSVKLTLGLKLEEDPYFGWTTLPDVRLAWSPGARGTLWLSAARAIRAATPFDVDVVEVLGSTTFLTGSADFESEKVTTYSVGYRANPAPAVSFAVTGFYNDYRDLRTIEPASATAFLPLRWGNRMYGSTYGLEAWASFQVAPWLRISPSVRTLEKRLGFEPGASRILGLAQAGNDPRRQANLRAELELGRGVTLDADLRYVGALPAPATDSYYEMNANLVWQVSPSVELSLRGQNLLNPRHLEFAAPDGEYVERSLFVQGQWRF